MCVSEIAPHDSCPLLSKWLSRSKRECLIFVHLLVTCKMELNAWKLMTDTLNRRSINKSIWKIYSVLLPLQQIVNSISVINFQPFNWCVTSEFVSWILFSHTPTLKKLGFVFITFFSIISYSYVFMLIIPFNFPINLIT